jgi:hypothetical protein
MAVAGKYFLMAGIVGQDSFLGSCILNQWYSAWGTHTPRGTRKHLTWYVQFKERKKVILFRDKH